MCLPSMTDNVRYDLDTNATTTTTTSQGENTRDEVKTKTSIAGNTFRLTSPKRKNSISTMRSELHRMVSSTKIGRVGSKLKPST